MPRLAAPASLCILLLASAAAGSVPDDLIAALKNFRADAPRSWSFLQTTTAEGKSIVERCDAARPEWERWSLVQKDGRAPTPEESRDYFEARSRRSRGGSAPKLAEQFDLSSAEILADDGARLTLRCRLKPAEGGDRTANFLRATLVVHRPTATLESIELRSTGPFSPTFGVKIAEMHSRLTYSLPGGDTPSLPQRVETKVRGTAFWVKSLDAEMTVVFSEYSRTTRQ